MSFHPVRNINLNPVRYTSLKNNKAKLSNGVNKKNKISNGIHPVRDTEFYQRSKISNGVHLIADIITGGSILCGLFSIICSMDRNYSLASWLIIIAVLFDAIDGKIARLSKAYSDFGREFDSLADIVSFGVAPAVLTYTYILKSANMVGLFVLFLYLICGAFRLARFNLYSKQITDDFFIGLPITVGGGFLASCVLISLEYGIIIKAHFFLPILIILSYLMASKIKYPNFGRVRNIRWIKVFILLAIGIYLTIAFPELVIWLTFLIYILTGHLFVKTSSLAP